MASNNEGPPPDLASILKTLASLTPQNHQTQAEPAPYQLQPLSPQLPPQAWPRHAEASRPPVPRSTTPPGLPRSTTPPGLQKIHIDPATIIDWSAGLRCVMKIVAKNDSILDEVRRMIKVQNDHELQWFNGREALIEKQKARKDGQKKLDEVLKAVGGTVSVGESNTSPEELAKELETFDMKVYRAQMEMNREMTNRLRSLGVPFFGTRSNLVRSAGKEVTAEDTKDGKIMIDEVELVKLQRKMLAILEDLCND